MKWKNTILSLVLLLLLCPVMRAEVVANKNGKCGYVDPQGNLIIDYKYDFIGPFSEKGIAMVKKGKKFGLVDRNGRELLPTKYDQIIKRPDGRMLLMNGTKFGFASAEGRLLHEPAYLHLSPFNSDGVTLALVKKKKKAKLLASDNTYALVNSEGKELVRTNGFALCQLVGDNDIVRVYKQTTDTFNTNTGYFFDSKTQTYYDLEGNIVINDAVRTELMQQLFGKKSSIKKKHKDLSVVEYNPSYDIVAFKYNEKIDDKRVRIAAGYYDLKKKKILFSRVYTSERQWNSRSKKYSFVADSVYVDNKRFYDGYAVATITGAGSRSGDYLLNTQGSLIARFKAEACYNFENGYMVACDNSGRYGLLNSNLDVVVPYQYTSVKTAVNNKGIWSVKHNGQWGVIDAATGKLLAPFEYSQIVQWKKGNVFFAKKNGKWGAFERDKQIVDCLYDSLYSYIDNSFIYQYGNQYGMYSISRHTMSPAHDGYENCYMADSIYHDNQLRLFYLLTGSGIKTYGFLNGFGEKAIPFMFTDRDQAMKAYRYMRNQPLRVLSKSDRRRLRLQLTKRTRTYKLDSVIPASEWDY